jgi:hypothetical protein
VKRTGFSPAHLVGNAPRYDISSCLFPSSQSPFAWEDID